MTTPTRRPLVFSDGETISLRPGERGDMHVMWELALILRDPETQVDTEYLWQLPVDAGKADTISLNIGGWNERRWPEIGDASWADDHEEWLRLAGIAMDGRVDRLEQTDDGQYVGVVVPLERMREWATMVSRLTWHGVWIGAVPGFDDRRVEDLLRANGACSGWHYHLADVETLAVGWIAGQLAPNSSMPSERRARFIEAVQPPWDSDTLSEALGVDRSKYPAHTALGDTRWARDLYDAILDPAWVPEPDLGPI